MAATCPACPAVLHDDVVVLAIEARELGPDERGHEHRLLRQVLVHERDWPREGFEEMWRGTLQALTLPDRVRS